MSANSTSFRPFARMGWGGRAASHFRGVVRGAGNGTVVYRSPGGFANWEVAGVTRDTTGAALGNCELELFDASDQVKARTTSDSAGLFSIGNPGTGPFYLVAYKTGSPDVAGTSVRTLMPTAL